MLQSFLTTQQTAPPAISGFWWALMILGIGLTIWLSIRWADRVWYRRLIAGLQIGQLLSLYAWYVAFAIPLSNSLPLYHCRMAMFVLVFWPGKHPAKQYFALLGFAGAVFALAYPVFDPYSFPHITGISFLVGHYALLANSIIYLMRQYDPEKLFRSDIIVGTFMLDMYLVAANLYTGGNYGLMRVAPIIGTTRVAVNYLLVSSILSLTMVLMDRGWQSWARKKEVA